MFLKKKKGSILIKFKVIESEVKMVYEDKTWILELELFEIRLIYQKTKGFFFLIIRIFNHVSEATPRNPLLERSQFYS